MSKRPESAPKPPDETEPPLDPDTRPRESPSKVKVTPLDEDRNVKDGIQVEET